MWQKLSKCYPPQVEIISLILLAFAFYIVLSNYAILPDTIPTHFDAQGIPDDWGSKNTIFLFPSLNAFIYLGCTFLNIWFAIVEDPRRLISLPQKRLARLTEEQTEKLRIFLNRCLFLLKILIQSLTVYGVYITIEIALAKATGLGTPFLLFIGTIIALASFMIWQSFRITSTHGSDVKLS